MLQGNIDLNKFVGGYSSEEEIAEAREQAKELHEAVVRLMNNPDFMKIYTHYTVQTVLEDASKASYAAEHRPVLFESILSRKAFEAYIKEMLSINVDELGEDDLDSFEG